MVELARGKGKDLRVLVLAYGAQIFSDELSGCENLQLNCSRSRTARGISNTTATSGRGRQVPGQLRAVAFASELVPGHQQYLVV